MVVFCSSAHVTVDFCHFHIHQRLKNHLKWFCYTFFGSFLLSIPIQSSKLNLVGIFFLAHLKMSWTFLSHTKMLFTTSRRRRARFAKRFKYCLLVDKSNGTFVVQAVLCKKASKWSVDVDGGWLSMKVNVIHNGMRAAPRCLCVHLCQRWL